MFQFFFFLQEITLSDKSCASCILNRLKNQDQLSHKDELYIYHLLKLNSSIKICNIYLFK